jgi:outer membrane protein assembly complex protein YaeT
MRVPSRLRKIAGSVIAAVVLPLLAGIALVHTPPAKKKALEAVVSLLRRQGIAFEASSLDYNLLGVSVALRNVTVRSLAAPGLPAVAKIGLVRAKLGLADLLSNRYWLQDAVLENVELHYTIDERGLDNLPRTPRPATKSGGETDWLIGKLTASGGSLIFEDRRRPLQVRLPAWQLTVTGNEASRNQTIRFTLARAGEISFERRTLALDAFSAGLVLIDRTRALEIQNVALTAGGSRVTLTGRVDNLSAPVLALKGAGSVALEPMARLAGIAQPARGDVAFEISVQGPPAAVNADVSVSSTALEIGRFRQVSFKAKASYNAAARRVRVPSLTAAWMAGRIDGSGDIALTAGESSADVRIANFDLERAANVMALGTVPAAALSGRAAARWPGVDFEKVTGQGTFTLAATRSSAKKDVVPVSGAVKLTAQGGAATVTLAGVEALASRLDGTVTLDARRQLQGELALTAPLERTLTEASRFLGKEGLLKTPVSGQASAAIALGGSLERPTADLRVRASGIQAADVRGVEIDIDATANRDEAVVQSAAIRMGAQSLSAAGRVAWSGANPGLDVIADVQSASIEELLRALGKQDLPVAGAVTLHARFGGTLAQPAGEIELSGSNLSAWNEPLGNLTAKLYVADQVATVQSLRLEKQAGVLEGSGAFVLSSSEFSFNARAHDLRIYKLAVGGSEPVRGTLNFSARAWGTLEDPHVAGELAARELAFGARELGALEAGVEIAGGVARISGSAPNYNLSWNGTVGVNAPYTAAITVAAEGADLSKLPLETPLTGVATLHATAAGNLAEPDTLQGSAQLEKFELMLNGQPVRTEGPVNVDYAKRRATIRGARIAAANSQVELAGTLPLDETATDGDLRIAGTLDLAALSALLIPEQARAASGKVEISATLRGNLKRVEPTGSITLREGAYTEPGLEPGLTGITLEAQVKDGALTIDRLSAAWGSARIEGHGEAPFALLPADLPVEIPRKPGPAALVLDLTGLDLATLPATAGKVSGTVSVHVDAAAAKPDIQSLTARITLPELKLNAQGFALAASAPPAIAIRNGAAEIESLDLTGPETRLTVRGGAGLEAPYPLDLKVDGNVDIAVFALFTESIKALGDAAIHVAVGGNADAPKLSGYLETKDSQLSSAALPVLAEGLAIRVEFAGDRIQIARLEGSLNGGSLSGSGGAAYRNGELRDVDIRLAANGAYLDYPEGLHTLSNSTLKLSSAGDALLLGGTLEILEGSYTAPLTLEGGLAGYLRSSRETEIGGEPSPLLSRLNLDVGVKTASPLMVRNNLAKVAIDMDLRVRGTAERTGLTGRMTVEEGGELYLNERKYLVDRGIVTFTNDRRIEPTLDILAETRSGSYDITLQVQSDAANRIETTLTSDPPLPEPDIISVLVTGKTVEETRGQEVDIARNQVLSYVTGSVGGSLSRRSEEALGLSQVRIEPSLIASETEPTARLTIGQDLRRNLHLIYSMNLRDSSDQIWIGQWEITRRFSTQTVRQNDNTYRFEFRHDLQFGIGRDAREPSQLRVKKVVGRVAVTGGGPFTQEQILARLKASTGKEYDFFGVRKGIDRLLKAYAKQNMLEARVRLERQEMPGGIDLNLNIDSGPAVRFTYEGWDPPGGLRKRVEQSWREGLFNEQRSRNAVALIRQELISDGYLQAEVEATIGRTDAANERVLFEIAPGKQYRGVRVVFEGARGVEASELRKVLSQQKLEARIYTDPQHVSDVLRSYYREFGYLDAEVERPRVELQADTGTGQVVIGVKEGPKYRVGKIVFTGNSAYSAQELANTIPFEQGDAFTPEMREKAAVAIEDLYRSNGYSDAECSLAQQKNPERGEVNLNWQIAENRRRVLAGVEVAGNAFTSEGLVRRQVGIAPGEAVGSTGLAAARRRLYATNAYSLVDVDVQEHDAGTATPGNSQLPVTLRLNVKEVQPFQIRYGGFYDTERGPGGIADFSNHNMLGGARVIGLRTRYDSELREARLYFTQPLLLHFPLKSTLSAYLRREVSETFITDRQGVTAELESRFRKRYIFTYGYRIENAHTFDKVPDPLFPFDIRLRIAPVTTSLTREARDEMLDATRGSFTSHSFEYASGALGSQLQFARYFGQYFKYIPLSAPQRVPWVNQIKSRLVYAGGVRVGLGGGLGGQELTTKSEQFFAGGGTTIRGFRRDRVGPESALGDPAGGNAVLILNNELRFPLFQMFDGVAFVDAGNVYPRIADFDVTDIRKSGGLGLRVRTPYFLLRLDYGVPFGRRPGEPRGQFFFSIGQAF